MENYAVICLIALGAGLGMNAVLIARLGDVRRTSATYAIVGCLCILLAIAIMIGGSK